MLCEFSVGTKWQVLSSPQEEISGMVLSSSWDNIFHPVLWSLYPFLRSLAQSIASIFHLWLLILKQLRINAVKKHITEYPGEFGPLRQGQSRGDEGNFCFSENEEVRLEFDKYWHPHLCTPSFIVSGEKLALLECN